MVTRSGLRPPVTGVFVRCDVHVNRRGDASFSHACGLRQGRSSEQGHERSPLADERLAALTALAGERCARGTGRRDLGGAPGAPGCTGRPVRPFHEPFTKRPQQ